MSLQPRKTYAHLTEHKEIFDGICNYPVQGPER